MSQQINLLHKPQSVDLSIWYAVGAFAITCLVLFGIAAYHEVQLYNLRDDARLTHEKIRNAQTTLNEKRRDAGLLAIDALEADITKVREKMNTRRDLMALIEKGEFGSPVGHSELFTVLARLGEPGVWIQGVDITKAGQLIAISGNALSNEAIMRYADQLNLAFKSHHFQFTSVEMSKEELSLISESGPKTSTMKFKLY